ncbi:MAG: 3'(2'),5'-bisphosphate nucleotidase [Phycisphaeraceae bacterium]|nr:3'(2'),5'-bisphosphate nucleotidase [Phycisphaeraceae bacterium]
MSLTLPRLQLAARAVAQAATLCRRLQPTLGGDSVQYKADEAGPVTVADFASQALVSMTLEAAERGTALLAEEHADDLSGDHRRPLLSAVTEAIRPIVGSQAGEDRVIQAISRSGPTLDGAGSYWTLDPIDGTKGFLRGGQFAVALAWIEQGTVELAALACPAWNRPSRPTVRGWVLAAARGQGLWAAPLDDSHIGHAWFDRFDVVGPHLPRAVRFCESAESAHSRHELSAEVARILGITEPPLRMDSQTKYAAVALGDASIYLRLPTRAGYVEKVWDHAAGKLCVEEAGGATSDTLGKPLDFSQGSTLSANQGVVATHGFDIARVIHAITRAREAMGPTERE